MSVSIVDRIRSAENLPSLPAVAVEILRLMQEDVSVVEISRVIQQDPALTGRLLRIVNSSLFGMPRQVSSLQQAVMVLGLRTVKVMVLGFSLVDTMRHSTARGFDFEGYWRRSLTTAVSARLLAEKVHRPSSEEAFVAGLLCDLGILAAVQCAPELYELVTQRKGRPGTSLLQAETEVLDVTHETLGFELLTQWGLPQSLCGAVGSHHEPLIDPAELYTSTLRGIIRAAAAIAGIFCGDETAVGLQGMSERVARSLSLEPQELLEILDALDVHVRETASLFALNIGETRDHQAIQAEAITQLARLSMNAEIERVQTARRELAARKEVELLHDQNTRLAQAASVDALTGIGNRAAFDRRIEEDCQLVRTRRQSIGLLIMDVDHFKALNDTYGHRVGDEVLRQVGACLRDVIRETTSVARYGGEEFAVIVRKATMGELTDLADFIRGAIRRSAGAPRQVTVSVGICRMSWDDPELSPAELVERADRCLYAAKRGGRDRIVVMDGSSAACAI